MLAAIASGASGRTLGPVLHDTELPGWKSPLSAHLPGLDQATADRLVQATHQVCPYLNATLGNTSVSLDVTV